MTIDIAGKLFPNFATMATQLIATGVMLYFFKRLLWVPMQKYLNARAEAIETNMKEASEYNERAKLLIAESEKQVQEAILEYKNTVLRAKDDATRISDEIIAEAKATARIRIEQTKKEIEMQKEMAAEAMRQEIVEVALEATRKIVDQEMDAKLNSNYIEEFVKGVKH